MAAIEPAVVGQHNVPWAEEPALPCDDGGDEKLRTVGVLSGIGHAQHALLGVLQLEVFVFELVSVDRLASCAISFGEVTALYHELLDDSVEARAFVAEAFLAGG